MDRKRQRDRQREKRQAERQTDREDRDRNTHTGKLYRDGQTDRGRYRGDCTQTDREGEIPTDRQTGKETDRSLLSCWSHTVVVWSKSVLNMFDFFF